MELSDLVEAINEDPDVKRTWALYQEARNGAVSGLAAGGPGSARVAVQQTRAAWEKSRKAATERLLSN